MRATSQACGTFNRCTKHHLAPTGSHESNRNSTLFLRSWTTKHVITTKSRSGSGKEATRPHNARLETAIRILHAVGATPIPDAHASCRAHATQQLACASTRSDFLDVQDRHCDTGKCTRAPQKPTQRCFLLLQRTIVWLQSGPPLPSLVIVTPSLEDSSFSFFSMPSESRVGQQATFG